MKKRIRLLIVSPISSDAVSSWRCLGPLNRLAKSVDLELVVSPPNAGWVELTGCDVLMMHRPFAPQHVQFMAMARQYGVPIWADYDDDLLNVMDDNPTYHNYSRAEVKESVKKCLQLADHVTVTTEDLRDLYLPYNGNITLAPNAVDPRFFKYREKKLFSNAVWWRGSDSHQKDLMSHSSGIIEAYNATQDRMQWNFVGYRPWFLLPQMPKAQFHPGRDFRLFYDYLCDHNPDVLHVPLHEHNFNHCKCLVPGTRVVTDGGIKRIEDVGSNDSVWQENDFKKVKTTYSYEKKPTLKFRTISGMAIEGTLHHKLRSNGSFKKMEEFKVGDFVDISTFDFPEVDYQTVPVETLYLLQNNIDKSKLGKNNLPKLTINEDWGRFIGFVLGDGCIGGKNRVSISCDSRYGDVVEWLKSFGASIGVGVGSSVKKYQGMDGFGVDLHFNSKNLQTIMSNSVGFKGVRGKVLRVPDIILKSPKSVIKEFIRGCFETDGCVIQTGCEFSTKQLELAQDIQFLLLGFGIRSKIGVYFNKKYQKNYYKVSLGRQAADIFVKDIGFISKTKQQKLIDLTSKSHSNAYKEWELTDEIVEITTGLSDVFDIEVPDKNYYLANGIVSHNSNIAAMEGSLAGAVIVAPSFKEWKQVPGLIHYTTPDTYGKAMLEAINLSPSEKKERREATAQWFLKERGLDKVNEHRLEVIRKLAGK